MDPEKRLSVAARRERPRVVIIDHDASVRALLRLHLATAGYEVLCAQDAIGGGYLVVEAAPDVVVCEARLPYMNGYEFVSALRSDPATRDVPVVLLTVKGETQQDAERSGIVASLKKPVAPERLIEMIRALRDAPRVSWAVAEPGLQARRGAAQAS
jgi:two-component system chemotaxis response regulator CheY